MGQELNKPSDSTVSAADSAIPSRSTAAPYERRIPDRVRSRHEQQATGIDLEEWPVAA